MSTFKKESAEVAPSPWTKKADAGEKLATSGLHSIISGLLSFGTGVHGTATGLGADKGLGPSSVMNFMADGAAAGLTTAADTATKTAPPKTEYVDMSAKAKIGALVDLMDDSRDVLTQNGVSAQGEEYLAGIMRNEGGRNERRKLIGNEFNKDADALRKLDINNVTAKQLKKLSPDQRALLEQAQAGTLDLNDRDAVQKAGIDRRTEQYSRMEELRKQKTRTKEEAAELKKLQGVHVAGGGTLDDFHGLSGDRFHEVFDEGQSRFELAQYKKFRRDFEKQGKKPKKEGDDMTVHAGIGNATLDPARQAKLQDNYDLFADYSTSYGTAQIMGLYAEQGMLTSKNGKGEDHTYSLDELKNSAKRFSPNSEDVGMQLAFMNMKGIDMSDPPSALNLAKKYNGTGKAQDYADKMTDGANAYHAAREAKDHPKPN